MVGIIKRKKIKKRKLKGIPKIKLKRLGRPLAKDVRRASRIGRKIAGEKIGGIKRKTKRRKNK